jgi:hypothetical protein
VAQWLLPSNGCCLVVSRSLPSNGSIRHSKNKTHEPRICRTEYALVQGRMFLCRKVCKSFIVFPSIIKQYQQFCQMVKAVPYNLRLIKILYNELCVCEENRRVRFQFHESYVLHWVPTSENEFPQFLALCPKHSISSKSVEWLVYGYSHPTCGAQHLSP